MIVVDATLIACLCVESPQAGLAEAALDLDPQWVAPVLWRSEFRNALVNHLQHGTMELDSAVLALHMAEDIVAGREYAVDSKKILELAAESGCPAYDCEYVALALDLGVPLVTTDKPILRAFPKTAVALERFAKKKK